MKTAFAIAALLLTTGCAHAHKPVHTHKPKAPTGVVVACAEHAKEPRKCVNRWRENNAYRHSHSHGAHARGHVHGVVHSNSHSHGKVKVGVGVAIPLN